MKAGEQAQLTVNEFPGHTFQAHVVSTAGAINPASKRLLTELQAPNPTGAPLAGAFFQTTLDIPIDGAGVMIPPMTVLFESGEPAVALVIRMLRSKFAKSVLFTISERGCKLLTVCPSRIGSSLTLRLGWSREITSRL